MKKIKCPECETKLKIDGNAIDIVYCDCGAKLTVIDNVVTIDPPTTALQFPVKLKSLVKRVII